MTSKITPNAKASPIGNRKLLLSSNLTQCDERNRLSRSLHAKYSAEKMVIRTALDVILVPMGNDNAS